MDINMRTLIGEATAYDKKERLEVKRPKSWLKSVSAFANGEGGTLVFGISDDDEIVGLDNAEQDAEIISEAVKAKIDPVPTIELMFKEEDGKKLVLLHVNKGEETPYYYIGDGQRLAFIRIGNESVVADRTQLKGLVMKGSGRTYDTLPSPFRFEDMAFTKLRSVHYKRLHRSFEDSEFQSWGIVDEQGALSNAGALIADESPVRHSRIFCTRWNGLTMTNGLGEAIDDVELEGCVISQLQDAVAFVRNNSHKKWWKEADHREELPDYPERAVIEAITNAIIHRDYMELGSEVHLDMYDDRLEVYSPGGMMDGSLIQQLNPLTVPSRRRNPLLADFFSRLNLMERRGSGMRKIIEAYKRYEHLARYRAPEFRSNATEFHVVLWNLNDEQGNQRAVKEFTKEDIDGTEKFTKERKKFTKESSLDPQKFTKGEKDNSKEFIKENKKFAKAQRQIYKLISQNSQITVIEMAEKMELSPRQVQKHLNHLRELNRITREGGRKNGSWKIIDEDYEGFFERI